LLDGGVPKSKAGEDVAVVPKVVLAVVPPPPPLLGGLHWRIFPRESGKKVWFHVHKKKETKNITTKNNSCFC
jgi:hypothetical protein